MISEMTGEVMCVRPVIKENTALVVACVVSMACNSKSYTIILWHVISMKLTIGKKIKGLEKMTLNPEKI